MMIANPDFPSARLPFLVVQKTSCHRGFVVKKRASGTQPLVNNLYQGMTLEDFPRVRTAGRGVHSILVPAKWVPERSVLLLTEEDHGTA